MIIYTDKYDDLLIMYEELKKKDLMRIKCEQENEGLKKNNFALNKEIEKYSDQIVKYE
jgi:hypothetical protein